jgi:hypothetical protein
LTGCDQDVVERSDSMGATFGVGAAAVTPKGERRLVALSALHPDLEELRRLAHQLSDLWEGLPDAEGH